MNVAPTGSGRESISMSDVDGPTEPGDATRTSQPQIYIVLRYRSTISKSRLAISTRSSVPTVIKRNGRRARTSPSRAIAIRCSMGSICTGTISGTNTLPDWSSAACPSRKSAIYLAMLRSSRLSGTATMDSLPFNRRQGGWNLANFHIRFTNEDERGFGCCRKCVGF